jgi:small conductance mechanosensitive channel
VSELADSSVNLVVRPWVGAQDYWPARFDIIERTKLAFDKAGISIPYPQRDVHLHQVDAA